MAGTFKVSAVRVGFSGSLPIYDFRINNGLNGALILQGTFQQVVDYFTVTLPEPDRMLVVTAESLLAEIKDGGAVNFTTPLGYQDEVDSDSASSPAAIAGIVSDVADNASDASDAQADATQALSDAADAQSTADSKDPNPPDATTPEIIVGTETARRLVSPKDIVDAIDNHHGKGFVSTSLTDVTRKPLNFKILPGTDIGINVVDAGGNDEHLEIEYTGGGGGGGGLTETSTAMFYHSFSGAGTTLVSVNHGLTVEPKILLCQYNDYLCGNWDTLGTGHAKFDSGSLVEAYSQQVNINVPSIASMQGAIATIEDSSFNMSQITVVSIDSTDIHLDIGDSTFCDIEFSFTFIG